MAGASLGKGEPDRKIYNLFAALNEEQQKENHDIRGLYEGRLRGHAQNFEGLKRKWEGLTGVPVPKKLRTSEPEIAPVIAPDKENAIPNQPSAAAAPDKKPAAKNMVKAGKATPARMLPHPDDKIDVDSMKVTDLRKELRKKQLSTSGRKHELQARLKQHLAEAKQKREAKWAAKYGVKKKDTQIKRVKIDNDGKHGSTKGLVGMDVVMEDASKTDVGTKNDSEKPVKKMVSSNFKDPLEEHEPVAKEVAKPNDESAMVGENGAKKQIPKSALKPSKYSSSAFQSTPQLGGAKPAARSVPSTLAKDDLPAPKQVIPMKVSDSSSESSIDSAVVSNHSTKSKTLQSSVQKASISSTLAQTTPGVSAYKTKVGGAGSAKLLQKKKAHAAATEARKARMAEMRQKAKPSASSVSSATKLAPTHSKYAVSSTLKKMATNSTLGESKPNNILAKMREKVASEKNAENAVLSSSMNSSLSSVNRVSQVTTSKTALKSTALKSIIDPANKLVVVTEPSTKPLPKQQEEKPLSPMQTYEMSDREEESESESESDEEDERQQPKKSIPEWAQKTNLHRALERQFAEGPERLDPDKIFGEVITCNLEEIFDKKKSRYQRRTSSGNWGKDHVTLAEKLTYKQTMGYDK